MRSPRACIASRAQGAPCSSSLKAAHGSVACNGLSSFAALAPTTCSSPLVELQRLALEAQAECDRWSDSLQQHELHERQLKARLDATARQQETARAALASLQQLLHQARHAAQKQHTALFAETVFMCGRQRRSHDGADADPEHRALMARHAAAAAAQLCQYEAHLTRLVGTVVASMAAAQTQSLPSGLLPSAAAAPSPPSSDEDDVPLAAAAAPSFAPLAGGAAASVSAALAVPRPANNIVPRKPSSMALMVQQRQKAIAAAAARAKAGGPSAA